jgi:hypothetical protein
MDYNYRTTRNGKPTIGVYGTKTRALQRRLSYEAFGLSAKNAFFYLYLGDKATIDTDRTKFDDKVLFEIRDRVYSQNPVRIPIGVEPASSMPMDFSRFGLINPLTSESTYRIHIDDTKTIGRYPVVGDVFEIDFYNNGECNRKALWEITDVDKNELTLESYVITITATPVNDSRSMQDLHIGRSNDDIFSDIMIEADDHYNEYVDTTEIEFDHSKVPVGTNISYINSLPESFLEDPFATFKG